MDTVGRCRQNKKQQLVHAPHVCIKYKHNNLTIIVTLKRIQVSDTP
jgi:hypothetical protein